MRPIFVAVVSALLFTMAMALGGSPLPAHTAGAVVGWGSQTALAVGSQTFPVFAVNYEAQPADGAVGVALGPGGGSGGTIGSLPPKVAVVDTDYNDDAEVTVTDDSGQPANVLDDDDSATALAAVRRYRLFHGVALVTIANPGLSGKALTFTVTRADGWSSRTTIVAE